MSRATEFVNRWMDAVNRGDLDELVDMCHADAVHSNPNGTFRGPQGVRDLFKAIVDASSERAVQISNVVESDGTVVVEFVFLFRNTGPMVTPEMTVPATGKNVRLPSISIYELRDGKVAASRGMYDRLELITQLGLMGTPAPSSRG